MTFEEVIGFVRDGGVYRGEVPEHWQQGRAAYGGVLAAAGYRALRREMDAERVLRQFSIAFVGAGSTGLELTTQLLASGKNIATSQATIRSGGEVVVQMTATFAKARFSSFSVGEEPKALDAEPVGFPLDGAPGVPRFTQNIDYRWTRGGIPYLGDAEPGLGGYCRHKTAVVDPMENVIGLLDAWPPTIVPVLTAPAPLSSVTWTAHFYAPARVAYPAEAWWYYESDNVVFSDGYATAVARLWAPTGELAAWSEQLIAVYEKPRS